MLPCLPYIKPWLFIVFLVLFLPQFTLGANNIQEDIQANIPLPTAIALERAQKLTQASKTSEALDLLEKFKKEQMEQKNQLHPFIFFTLGNLYMEANKAEKAALNYEACVKEGTGGRFSSCMAEPCQGKL